MISRLSNFTIYFQFHQFPDGGSEASVDHQTCQSMIGGYGNTELVDTHGRRMAEKKKLGAGDIQYTVVFVEPLASVVSLSLKPIAIGPRAVEPRPSLTFCWFVCGDIRHHVLYQSTSRTGIIEM